MASPQATLIVSKVLETMLLTEEGKWIVEGYEGLREKERKVSGLGALPTLVSSSLWAPCRSREACIVPAAILHPTLSTPWPRSYIIR